MGVASGCGEQEVGVASGSGWNLWVWLLGVVVRRYRISLNKSLPRINAGSVYTPGVLVQAHSKYTPGLK